MRVFLEPNNRLLLPRIDIYDLTCFLFLVGKGQVHEGIIHNSDKGSVITWDFDVMRHDVVFTVYRLRIPLPIVSHCTHFIFNLILYHTNSYTYTLRQIEVLCRFVLQYSEPLKGHL